jgi:sialidase-1
MIHTCFRTRTALTLTALAFLVAPAGVRTAYAADIAERAQETAAPALFEDVHVVPLPVKNYGYRGMPGGMILLKDGRILLGYTHMTPEGNADGSVAGRYSSDKGKTWGDEFILVQTPLGQGRVCHPSFVRLQNDEILMSYIYSANTKRLYGHNYYRRSADETATWSDQLIMTPRPGYNIMHNDKLTVLSTGRVIGAVEFEFSNPENDHGGYVSYTVYSDNNGHSWDRSENEVNALPVEAQEPQVVELKDGRLMMLMRTYSAYVIRAYSDNQGETWSKHEDVKELKLPTYTSSALSVKRIPSTGDLLVLRCSGGPKEPFHWRTPFVSVISRDDGKTWESERVIGGDPENDYGYPSLMFVDEIALISYHQRDGLHVARIGIDWFYGK